MEYGIKDKQYFVSCQDQRCEDIFLDLYVDSGFAQMKVSESITFLPIKTNSSEHIEYSYNEMCKTEYVHSNALDSSHTSPAFSSCNNINSTRPLLYVSIDKPLSETIGQLRVFNVKNITEGRKWLFEYDLKMFILIPKWCIFSWFLLAVQFLHIFWYVFRLYTRSTLSLHLILHRERLRGSLQEQFHTSSIRL